MVYQEYIEINPEMRFGRPCIIGRRISAYDVLGWLAHGMKIHETIEDFPESSEKAFAPSPDHQFTESPDHQITRSPVHQFTR